MSDFELSVLIRLLSDDYSNNRISFTEYRQQRTWMLQKLDEDINQVCSDNHRRDSNSTESDSEFQQVQNIQDIEQ